MQMVIKIISLCVSVAAFVISIIALSKSKKK
nr:MAG TPA: hypothetical protein [Caudoviricetes sp.]